jgi:serralysin
MQAPDPLAPDRITDFSSEDILQLSGQAFGGLAAGKLAAAAFVVGPSAVDTQDRFIWYKAKGELYYDADGSDAGEKVLFLIMAPGTALAASDFLIV